MVLGTEIRGCEGGSSGEACERKKLHGRQHQEEAYKSQECTIKKTQDVKAVTADIPCRYGP